MRIQNRIYQRLERCVDHLETQCRYALSRSTTIPLGLSSGSIDVTMRALWRPRGLPRGSAQPISVPTRSLVNFSLSQEQIALQQLARTFTAKEIIPVSTKHDISGEWPSEVFKKAWSAGLVNMHIPKQYGGLGLHAMDGVIVAEELAYGDAGMLAAIEINTIAEVPVIMFGNEEQKKHYLTRMIEEPLKAAYCVTEPGTRASTMCETRHPVHAHRWLWNDCRRWQ